METVAFTDRLIGFGEETDEVELDLVGEVKVSTGDNGVEIGAEI